jgi:hypothetical protein
MWVWNETNERIRSWGMLLSSQHFGGRRVCWSYGTGLGRMTSTYSLTRMCTNQTTRWLMHSLSTFGVRTSHGQLRTHKTHHGPDLGEATIFPFIVFFVALHGDHIKMAFCFGTPKWESQNSRNSHSWDSYNFGGP